MYYTRKYKKRSKTVQALKRVVKYCVVCVPIVLIIGIVTFYVHNISAHEKLNPINKGKSVAQPSVKEADVRSEINGKYYGLCARNTIRTVEDFRRTVEKDAVLAQHFSGFKWESAKVDKLDEDVWTFVSYRKGDVIQFTTKPVRLPKGDTFISDGIRRVRTLCCNDYEPAPPPVEVSTIEPTTPRERVDGPSRRFKKETVDAPPLKVSLSEMPPLEESAGAIPPLKKEIPPYNEIPPHYVQRRYSSSHPHVVTPEPGSFLLMGCGVIVGALLLTRRNNR